MLSFMKISISWFSSEKDDRLALKMSFSIENKRYTAARKMAGLNLMNTPGVACYSAISYCLLKKTVLFGLIENGIY